MNKSQLKLLGALALGVILTFGATRFLPDASASTQGPRIVEESFGVHSLTCPSRQWPQEIPVRGEDDMVVEPAFRCMPTFAQYTGSLNFGTAECPQGYSRLSYEGPGGGPNPCALVEYIRAKSQQRALRRADAEEALYERFRNQ